MSHHTLAVDVDVTNPGEYFACCGLLELAHRLWPNAEGWFQPGEFSFTLDRDLPAFIQAVADAELKQVNADDETASPICIGAPFDRLLDWWRDDLPAHLKPMKVWAGRMNAIRIARAMQQAMLETPEPAALFAHGGVVYEPDDPKKKVEPFYFDARRGTNATSLDVGFATDALSLTTTSHPAVEFLCLVGLQRFRPQPTDQRRVYRYCAWTKPLSPTVAPALANLSVPDSDASGYEFEVAFRTDQKKHKSFIPATRIGGTAR